MVTRRRGITLFLFVVGLAFSAIVLNAVPHAGALSPPPIVNLPRALSRDGAIAYSSDISGNSEIYTTNSTGSATRQLTHSAEEEFAPIWSPDGTKLAFLQMESFPTASSYPAGDWSPISVHVVNPDGSQQRNLTPKGDQSFRNLVWSPDGTQLAVECSQDGSGLGNGQICVLNVDGTGMHRVVPPQLFGTTPSWSPDGRWIAFLGQASSLDQPGLGIYLVSPDGREQRTVLQGVDSPDSFSWSPDGTKLAYTHGRSFGQLTVVNVDGSDRHDLDTGNAPVSDPQWSPDGSKLLLASNEVDVINVDGTGLREVIPPKDNALSAIWSPDGQAIAFTYGVASDPASENSERAASARLDVVKLDGSPPRTVVDEAIGPSRNGLLDWPPSWQPVAPTPGS